MGVGLVIAGLTAYGFLVVSARALGRSAYAPLSVLWAMVFLAGPGFFLPLEQEVSRVLASRRAQRIGSGPVLRRAAVLGGGLAAVLVVATVAGGGPLLRHLLDDQALLLAGFVLALLGYCVGHLARGTFSGTSRFSAYSVYIGAEGSVRLAVCVALAAVGVSTAGPYGLALGVAPFVAVALAARGQRQLLEPGPEVPWRELTRALGSLLAGSVLAQGLVNAGPLAVQLLATEEQADEAGRFLAGLVIARVPLFLFAAVQAALLPRLSALAGAGRIDDFRGGLRRLVVVVAAVGAVATAGAFAVGPEVVRLLFGREFVLDHRTVGLLAAGSAAYMLAIALAQALIALSGHGRMALSWLAGILTFVVVTALGGELFLRVEIGLLAGSSVAAALMGALVLHRIAEGAAVEPGDFIEAMHEVPVEP